MPSSPPKKGAATASLVLGIVALIFAWFGYALGIVFYGAVIGGIVGMIIYAKYYKTPILPYFDLLAPVLPIAHAIGRIGCLLGGCCYGVELPHGHPLSITYPTASLSAPAEVPLFAFPPVEGGFNLIISAFLFIYSRRNKITGRVTSLYLILYAVVRFGLEFYRGDAVRGIFLGISASQYISICVGLSGIILFIKAPGLQEKTNADWLSFLKKCDRIKEMREQRKG